MIPGLKHIISNRQTAQGTGHKQINEALAVEQVYINALMDNISDHIYFKDVASRFLRINKAMASYFNLDSPSKAIGKTDFDFFTDEHARKAFEDEQKIIYTGCPIKREEKETWKNQSDSWVSTVKMPLYNSKGEIIGTFGISRDITLRARTELALKRINKELEARNKEYQRLAEELQALNMELITAREIAEKSDRLKSAFLQNMSHEIRTPLTAIMGFSDLMRGQLDNKTKLDEFNRIIDQQCTDLLNIINGILDIAKIESGQLPVYTEVFGLGNMFSELTDFFQAYQNRARKEEVQLNFGIDHTVSGLKITSDKTKLKQVLVNLIENAFKFTRSGIIRVGCTPDINGGLKFFVSDTGIGIPANKQAYVFERFAQVEDGPSRTYGGTGLGLSIVKGFIELLGGKIWLTSEPGKGSVFYFSLPGCMAVAPVKVKETGNTITGKHPFKNKTLLIVEDDPYNSRYLKEILTLYGASTLHTGYGKEAVDISSNQHVDLILMDIRLPDIDGYEATRMIKIKKPHIKIIAQTAYASLYDKEKVIESGFDGYISKPINQNKLIEKIHEELGRS